MEPLVGNEENGEGLNLSCGIGIGMKRVSGEVEGISVVKKVRLEIDENFVAVDKEARVDESKGMVLDESIGHIGEVAIDILEGGGEVKNGAVGAGEFIIGCQEGGLLSVVEESPNAIQVLTKNANWGNGLGFDLNIPALEAGDWDTSLELNGTRSDESDHYKERDEGNAMQLDDMMLFDAFENFEHMFEVMDKDQDIGGGGGPLGGERRYTREEKGKAQIDHPWLSLTDFTTAMSSGYKNLQQEEAVVTAVPQLEPRQNVQVLPLENVQVLPNENVQVLPLNYFADVRQRLIAEGRKREALALRQRAHHFARYDALHEGSSSTQENKLPTLETIKVVGNSSDPFSTALKRIKERIPQRKDEKPVRWKASQHPDNKHLRCVIPSLLDLSVKALAENAEAVVSLEGVPDILRRRLTGLLCKSRKMTNHMLDLLVQGSPTQIRIEDCSWLEEKQFCKSFSDFDRRNLVVLQLDLCGQCNFDILLGQTIAPGPNSLPNLAILSLRGACRMTDQSLERLVVSAPSLQSIDLGQCSLLTHTSIHILANSLGSVLNELYVDDCQTIDAMFILPALERLEHLEVLSVAGIPSICDQFVSELLTLRGKNLKELNFADCQNLTDHSLKFIGDACANLQSLNISKLSKMTDLGLQFLTNGCRSIRRLKLSRNSFSDEGFAAFLEASGAYLEELSLNNCSKVSTSTVVSLAKFSRNLVHLDLSWCRKISDEELGLIVDSCMSLKLLKLFGCTQITDVFVNGHSNTAVEIVGLGMAPFLDNISKVDGMEVLLMYSPPLTSSNI